MGLLWIPGLGPRRKPQEGPRYADIYSRGVAAAIDLGWLYLLLHALFRYIGGLLYAHIDPAYLAQMQERQGLAETWALMVNSGLLKLWLINSFIQFSMIGAIYVSVQIFSGTTPGRWVIGLQVVKAKSLEPVQPWRYVLRFLGYVVALTPLMLGIFWASFSRTRRGWHDYIAGTAVIHTRPVGWSWIQAKRLYFYLRAKAPPLGGGRRGLFRTESGKDGVGSDPIPTFPVPGKGHLFSVEQPVGEPAAEEGDRNRS